MKRCPHCEEIISNLRYEIATISYGSEFGLCDLEGDDQVEDNHDHNDMEYGDSSFFCPECGEELFLSDLDRAPDVGEEDEEEEEKEERPLTVDEYNAIELLKINN